MPTWQPNWNNVRWNFDAANQAVAALRHAAEEIERTASERVQIAERAKAQWRGPHRTTFDAYLDQTLRDARTLANEYRAAAQRIMQASYRARDEQQQRLRSRERWLQEKQAEDRVCRKR